MVPVFMGNALWQLIKQSDNVSKFVLVLLLIMSVVCWAIFIYKLILIRMKKHHLESALAQLKNVETLDQMLDMASKSTGTMQGYLLSRNLTYLKGILESRLQGGITVLSEMQWRLMQQNLYNTVDDMIKYEESYLYVLSTSAAVAPLLGLFGTIWGLIHAFIGISQRQSADIATVAPGIAEALITTLAGLIVAIPALIMFNMINVQISNIEQKLLTLTDRVSIIFQRLFVR
jgi:biopolymer transport protein TolQ